MTVRNLKSLLTILVLFSSCTNLTNSKTKNANIISTTQNKKVSRLLKFEYGGYDDTVVALIYGNVYQTNTLKNSSDTLPLSNVSIKVEQNSKTVLTDNAGQFQIGLKKGTFSLVVSKEGYQSLRLTNYVSDPDQISNTIIILEKGNGLQTIEIPK